MLPLFELQQAFADWVLRGETPTSFTVAIESNDLTAHQRLSVYRNNTQLGLTEALRDGYPVVNKLVGADFFNQMARDFIRQFPPKSGCLLFYGECFADFIQASPTVVNLPYLPDVARLEWFWHEAFHEADGHAMSSEALKYIQPEQYANLILSLQPSVRLFSSAYPVLAIWQGNQDGGGGDGFIDLNQGGNRVLVYRPHWEVLMISLAEPEYRFLLALQQGLPLDRAVMEAINVDISFDLFAALQRGFACGLFTGFTFATNNNQEI